LSQIYVLDAFALLAYLRGEPGAERVRDLLLRARSGEARLYLCLVNYGEVLYISERQGGRPAAEEAIRIIDHLPLETVLADRDLTFAAAHLKARYPISYADAFAAALAQKLSATLVTGDPEFRKVEAVVEIEWLTNR
jgi:predicted nucleic acid-binding protein